MPFQVGLNEKNVFNQSIKNIHFGKFSLSQGICIMFLYLKQILKISIKLDDENYFFLSNQGNTILFFNNIGTKYLSTLLIINFFKNLIDHKLKISLKNTLLKTLCMLRILSFNQDFLFIYKT